MVKAMANSLLPKPLGFKIEMSVEESESIIRQVGELPPELAPGAKIPSHSSKQVLTDLWAAAAVGTLLRRTGPRAVVARGMTQNHTLSAESFASTLPGLVATALGSRVEKEEGTAPAYNFKEVRQHMERDLAGYLNDGGGSERMIVEFGDQRAACLEENSEDKQRFDRPVFADVILRIRDELDIKAKIEPAKLSTAAALKRRIHFASRDQITILISELFENAYQHGRVGVRTRPQPDFRCLRFRKIFRDQPAKFAPLFSAMPPLQEFVEAKLRQRSDTAFLEITVSDYGNGIVDTFLSSPVGRRYADRPREELLDKLLYERLSSTVFDQQAGLGISKALRAAQDLGVFISVRTNEFWRARNYASDAVDLNLQDVPGSRAKVAGTHWTILWAAPPV